jgi:hypothetical protein
MTPTTHPTMARMSGTWTIEDATQILKWSGHKTTEPLLRRWFREQEWVAGPYGHNEITVAGWPYLDMIGKTIVVTGPGIAAVHRALGGAGDIRVDMSVIR